MKSAHPSAVAVKRFRRELIAYGLGRRAAVRIETDGESGPDCSGCADPALRDALGYTEAEWQALCGPTGLSCPVIA